MVSISFRKIRSLALVAGVCFSVILPSANAAETGNPDSWQFAGEIYAWMPELAATTPNGSSISIPFDDILDNLEVTFMGVFAARKEKWTILADVIYMDLSHTKNFSRSVPDISGSAKATMESWIISPTVMYNLVDTKEFRLDAVGGLRYLWVKAKLNLDLDIGSDPAFGGKASFDEWDGVIGLNTRWFFGEHWNVGVYADVGAGGSEATWQALTSVGYRFDNWSVNAGYRYMEWYFDDGSNDLMSDLTVEGPFLGAMYRF